MFFLVHCGLDAVWINNQPLIKYFFSEPREHCLYMIIILHEEVSKNEGHGWKILRNKFVLFHIIQVFRFKKGLLTPPSINQFLFK
jgi:hypothetical protein